MGKLHEIKQMRTFYLHRIKVLALQNKLKRKLVSFYHKTKACASKISMSPMGVLIFYVAIWDQYKSFWKCYCESLRQDTDISYNWSFSMCGNMLYLSYSDLPKWYTIIVQHSITCPAFVWIITWQNRIAKKLICRCNKNVWW